MKTIFLDGRYLKAGDQTIEAFTPGVFKTQGVFETMLGLDGAVLDVPLHLKRLRAGLKLLGIQMPDLKPSLLEEVLRRNRLACARLRLMVWLAGQKTHVMAAALPYQIPDKDVYRVCLIKTDRRAHARWADVKSLDYGVFAEAHTKARARGFDEALLLNSRGYIFEASRANIFWTKNKVLYTPPLSSGCLNGITRRHVIQQAQALKIPFQEKNLTPGLLKEADTAFLTNSLIGIKLIAIS